MKRVTLALLLTLALLPSSLRVGSAAVTAPPRPILLVAQGATELELLAAREVRRYVYLRSGFILNLETAETLTRLPMAGAVIVARNDRPLARLLAETSGLLPSLAALEPDQFWLRTCKPKNTPILLLTGGHEVSTLYAAYRFAETLGVRFFLHGDVTPDTRVPFSIPFLDERHAPLFAIRGIQPFHDFPEGPDWWNLDDYAAVIGQLPKLRMNFLGLHTYPEQAPNAEPTVWIGTAEDHAPDGRVQFSYPASYMNTLRGNWGYAAKPTRDFTHGGALLFEHDAFGPDVMLGDCPQPEKPEDCNRVFNRTTEMLRDAFTLARRLGVKTCVGTETPLTVPQRVRERLAAAGRDPAALAVHQQLYEGMFQRIMRAYPIDYYWFWTPEGWTWEGTRQEQIDRTLDDVLAAIAAATRVQAPFKLATCGWVLGPQQDRALFDKVLPKDITVSCINREVGRTPVDRGFSEVMGRSKWAIPWMEDDPALTSPQLWVGRMRRDASDARRYGCDGLLGIHWRTRVLGPNVLALAQAAWDQSAWNPTPFEPPPPPPRVAGPVGGNRAAFPNQEIADTEEDPVYQTVRYNLSAYQLPLPNGAYSVTLKFCEPHYKEPGKRVFTVKLQGQTTLDRLDLFARVGAHRAFDHRLESVAVTNGWLEIAFIPHVEFPSIAGLVIEGPGVTRRINCGGPAWGDYAADWPPATPAAEIFPPVNDFYLDWATHEFGEAVAASVASILERIDGRLPRPSDWVNGPGGIRPDERPWEEVRAQYDFVAQLESLQSRVQGPGNRARFDYWLETFRYHRAMARVNCSWAVYNRTLARATEAATPSLLKLLLTENVLPVRRELVRDVETVYRHLLATVSTPGELGTVANWDQHLLPDLLTKPGEQLAQLLGEPLPADAQPSPTYRGPTRVIVPTVRTSLRAGEPLRLKVRILAEQKPENAQLRWRRFGQSTYRSVPLRPLTRGVYEVALDPSVSHDDFEYYIEVASIDRGLVRFPPTAPSLNQTVVVVGR